MGGYRFTLLGLSPFTRSVCKHFTRFYLTYIFDNCTAVKNVIRILKKNLFNACKFFPVMKYYIVKYCLQDKVG